MMSKQNPLNAGGFPLGSTQSRAAARGMLEAKKRQPNILNVTNYARDPSVSPERVSCFTDHKGQLWEVWEVSYQPRKTNFPVPKVGSEKTLRDQEQRRD
jgi:hypothetical protein